MRKLQVGDRLLIRCAPRRVRVERVFLKHVVVEWPWASPDPDSRYTWTGGAAVPCDPARPDWYQSPWRLEPHTGLKVGDFCEVSIPPTEVVVLSVHEFDPPRDLGRLPRAHSAAVVAAIDSPEDDGEHDFSLYFPFAEPIEISPVDEPAS